MRFPAIIKQAARDAGATAQFAGGVPAMCDGVTRGEPGMELSLFSRDVIALANAVALSHDMFDAALCLGICNKIVPSELFGVFRANALGAEQGAMSFVAPEDAESIPARSTAARPRPFRLCRRTARLSAR